MPNIYMAGRLTHPPDVIFKNNNSFTDIYDIMVLYIYKFYYYKRLQVAPIVTQLLSRSSLTISRRLDSLNMRYHRLRHRKKYCRAVP